MRILVLLACTCVALALASEPAEVTPGRHNAIPCPGSQYHYSLYIPARYATEPAEHRFPVLYLSSPTGNPGTMDLDAWAERNGVIIVGFNDSQNGLSWNMVDEIQDTVRAHVKQTLRTHPVINFAAGISGGANCSMRLVDRYPNEFAGVLMICMGGTPKASHISCGWIHGAKDDVVGVGSAWKSYDTMKGSGRPCTIVVNRGRQHSPGSRQEKEDYLDYALMVAGLTHPRLPPAVIKANYHELNTEMAATDDIADPATRKARIELLARMPNAARCPAFNAMAKTWGETALEIVRAANEPHEQLELLMRMASEPLAQRMDNNTKRACRVLQQELVNEPANRAHWEAVAAYDKLFEMEQRAGLNKTKLQELKAGFQALANAYPEHPNGIRAAKDIGRIDRYLAR